MRRFGRLAALDSPLPEMDSSVMTTTHILSALAVHESMPQKIISINKIFKIYITHNHNGRIKLANFLISIFVDTNIICIVDYSCEYVLKFSLYDPG
jgi:hypothetical protein